jgi:hydrogenase small subunit
MSRKDCGAECGRFDRLDGYDGALGGLNRRDLVKFCTGVAASLGLLPYLGVRIAEAATAPPVFWLSGQACTGCTETLLRAYHPTVENLILDMISLDYHETLCAGAVLASRLGTAPEATETPSEKPKDQR